jgi:hypothetical protein
MNLIDTRLKVKSGSSAVEETRPGVAGPEESGGHRIRYGMARPVVASLEGLCAMPESATSFEPAVLARIAEDQGRDSPSLPVNPGRQMGNFGGEKDA